MIKGFTLVELSIVLVIIGLLVGGIMIGKSLIGSSEIRAQISQIETFKTAANSFKLKYGALPGDISPVQTAQLGFFTFTGIYAGQSYLLFDSVANGYIRYGFGNGSGDLERGEPGVFWQHLSEAKMVPGLYGGSPAGANYLQPSTAIFSTAGTVVTPITKFSELDLFLPQSKLSQTENHVWLTNNRVYTKVVYFNNTSLANIFFFFATPNQEFAIDSKIDDGLPYKGSVRETGTQFGGVGVAPCTNAASPPAYNVNPATADTINSCLLSMLW